MYDIYLTILFVVIVSFELYQAATPRGVYDAGPGFVARNGRPGR